MCTTDLCSFVIFAFCKFNARSHVIRIITVGFCHGNYYHPQKYEDSHLLKQVHHHHHHFYHFGAHFLQHQQLVLRLEFILSLYIYLTQICILHSLSLRHFCVSVCASMCFGFFLFLSQFQPSCYGRCCSKIPFRYDLFSCFVDSTTTAFLTAPSFALWLARFITAAR